MPLTSASPDHKVQGVVLYVTPLKKGKMGNSFFDRGISDGVATMQLVVFDSKVNSRIVEWEGKGVTMSQCEIKPGRHDGNGLEVHVIRHARKYLNLKRN